MSLDTKVRTEFLYIIHKKLAIRVSMFGAKDCMNDVTLFYNCVTLIILNVRTFAYNEKR